MNEVPQAKREVLAQLWSELDAVFELRQYPELGATVRKVAVRAHVAKATAKRYRPTAVPDCPCGQPAGHRGWCSFRFSRSTRRQALRILQFHGNVLQPILSSRCSVKACPYPAATDGLCRAHLMDRSLESSIVGSSLVPAIEEAHLLAGS